jgi:hypothetical protein
MPPKVLRVKNIEPHGDQRAGLRVEQSMRFGGTDQLVVEIFASVMDGDYLHGRCQVNFDMLVFVCD